MRRSPRRSRARRRGTRRRPPRRRRRRSRSPVGLSLVQPEHRGCRCAQTFTMKLHIDDPDARPRDPDAAIAIQRRPVDDVAQRLRRRRSTNGDLGGTLYVPNQIRALVAAARRSTATSRSRSGSPVPTCGPTIGINRPGVYPVEVQLVNTGVASGSFVTWLVAVDTSSPKPIDKKLSVAFVWPAVADPIAAARRHRRPEGRRRAEARRTARQDREPARAHRRASAARSCVGPETVEAWKRLGAARHQDRQPSFARVRARRDAIDDRGPARRPTSRSTSAALDAAGLGSYLPSEYATGTSALRVAFGANLADPAQSAFIDPVADERRRRQRSPRRC